MAEITVKAIDDNIPVVTDFINEALEAADCSMKAMTKIDIALDEILINIVNYAYPDGPGDMTVSLEITPDRMARITFTDSGIPYDPLAKPDPDVTLSAEERPIGGLGIFMVKKSMDALQYRYENGHNILTAEKSL